MINKTVIEFDNVSKRFKKGRKLLLKEAFIDIFKPGSTEWFWVLKDITFKVKRGETVGMIGVNGSGKSTILKLIAKVMVPEKGTINVRGKIAPLIELGAGFHPELSGRENVYLNGTILGLSRKEVDECFDSIVNFAELSDFIDTPIKHYSSGMYMRLGFAVAIHTEPDIFLVDEILAVGDEAFRDKCMKKMRSFQKRGISTVFISHNLSVVKKFCDRVIYIKDLTIVQDGKPDDVIESYVKDSSTKTTT